MSESRGRLVRFAPTRESETGETDPEQRKCGGFGDDRHTLAQLRDRSASQTMPANNPSNCALLLIFFPPSALHELLAPLFPNPRGWEPTTIRLPTAESRAPI